MGDDVTGEPDVPLPEDERTVGDRADPHLGRCDRCERKTWSPEALGNICGMVQPDGSTCEGTFRGEGFWGIFEAMAAEMRSVYRAHVFGQLIEALEFYAKRENWDHGGYLITIEAGRGDLSAARGGENDWGGHRAWEALDLIRRMT